MTVIMSVKVLQQK